MTHYRLSDSTPTAIILSRNPRTSSLDELKIYTNNHIFLNNGDEFKIRLFNPLTEKIGVQIGFNGQLSNSMLVLNPGEDVIVDRFLDDQRKMLFETYQYDKSNISAVNAVVKNGIVEIRFFKEYIQPSITYSNGTYDILHNVSGMGSVTINGIGGTLTTTNGTFTSFNTSNNNSRLYEQNVFLDQVSDSSLDFASDFKEEKTIKELKSKSTKKIKSETGRVEKGQYSDQNFKQVDIQFETYPFHDVVYNLKPRSEKDNYVSTEIREFCTSCGYRVRNNKWQFCPKCGQKL